MNLSIDPKGLSFTKNEDESSPFDCDFTYKLKDQIFEGGLWLDRNYGTYRVKVTSMEISTSDFVEIQISIRSEFQKRQLQLSNYK